MQTTTTHITRILLATTVALTAALATVDPPPADAHTLTPQTCQQRAITAALSVPPATPDEVTTRRRACLQLAAQHAIIHACLGRDPLPLVGRIRAKHRAATMQQRRNVTTALNVAHRMRAPRTHMVAVIAAAMQEQGLDNEPYGHGTSVGFLQLISDHGTVAWRMDVRNSAGWFLRGARQIDPRGRRTPGNLAQDVQASAHPDLYHQWVPTARRTVATYLRPCQRR